jgi:hypothetical protein
LLDDSEANFEGDGGYMAGAMGDVERDDVVDGGDGSYAAIEARGSLTEVKLILKGSLVVWLVLSLLFG